jgi:hypothetical protein
MSLASNVTSQGRDTRSGDELFASLARILASQAGVEARWT